MIIYRVKKPWRNQGNSWGLEYPIIFGEVTGFGWCCWNRHTGLITYCFGYSKNPYGYDFAKKLAEDMSRPENYNTNNAAQDSVP